MSSTRCRRLVALRLGLQLLVRRKCCLATAQGRLRLLFPHRSLYHCCQTVVHLTPRFTPHLTPADLLAVCRLSMLRGAGTEQLG